MTLETTAIDRITEKGLHLVDGSEIEADVIVYGTGFTATTSDALEVVGRDGGSSTTTGPGTRGPISITLPHFPNPSCSTARTRTSS